MKDYETEKGKQSLPHGAWGAVAPSLLGIKFWHVDGRITGANDAYLRLIGHTREELQAGTLYWNRLTPPEYLHLNARALDEMWSSGMFTPFEKEYLLKDGTRLPVLVGGSLLEGSKSEGVSFVLGTSGRGRTERLSRLLEMPAVNATDAVLITEAHPCDEPGPRILYANAAFSRMTGYALEEVLGKSPRLLQGIGSQRAALDRIRTALTRWEPVEVEVLNYRKDGSEFWVELSIAPVPSSESTCTHWIAIQRDITARKWLEQERAELLEREQRARSEAETANRIKDEFLATLSHELRTPLNAIIGFSQLLRRKLESENLLQLLDAVERNAKLQNRLIDDLLDVSRIVTGKLRLELRPMQPLEAVEAALETIRPAAEAKSVTLEARLEREVGPVRADSARLQQVVWNLLSNAVKFTPEGGRVEVQLGRSGSRVEIRVADTGQGIDPAFLPRVFERFNQADGTPTRRHGGLGLGLAIVRHLVELHGGEVSAESEGKGKGATFTVRLPLPALGGTSVPGA